MIYLTQNIDYKYIKDIINKNNLSFVPLEGMNLLDDYCIENDEYKIIKEVYCWGYVYFINNFKDNKQLTIIYIRKGKDKIDMKDIIVEHCSWMKDIFVNKKSRLIRKKCLGKYDCKNKCDHRFICYGLFNSTLLNNLILDDLTDEYLLILGNLAKESCEGR